MGGHKTKDQLERELDELKNSYARTCRELSDAIERKESLRHELDGVRGALNRESEMREKAEKDRDQYRQETVKWKNEAGDYHSRWEGACIERNRLRDELNEVEEIQRKHNKLTLESLDNALKQWNYVDSKLSHDLCMPLESLIMLLDEYGVNDFCKLRERLMYGPTTAYSNALAQVRKLEKENKDLKVVADDLEKQRRELEQKLSQERSVSMVQEARATDLEGQLRRKTNDCGDWMDRAFRDEAELRKVKEHDRIAQENFEKASRRNDELQNEVNRLQQRWTDTFNPEDEMLGRKVWEWQEINVVLAKHNISSPESLDDRLCQLGPSGKPMTFYHDVDSVLDKHGIDSAETLDKMISLLKARNMCRSLGSEWRDVVDKYRVGSPGELDRMLDQRQQMAHAFHEIKKDIEMWS